MCLHFILKLTIMLLVVDWSGDVKMTRFYIICIIIAFIIFFVSTNPNWIGKKGESIVTNKLHSLPRSRYYVLNDVLLRNNNFTSQIDHVVISPYGVFVIETKNYKGWITGGQYSEEWTQHLRGQKNNFRNPIRQNYGHIKSLERVLDLDESAFISVVVFSDRATLKVNVEEGVVNFKKLKRYILSYRKVKFSDEQIKRYAYIIVNANINSKETKKEHIKSVKSEIARKENDLKNGICPKCGGTLVKRKGKYGTFLGCSNYPQCRYTHNL